MFSPPGLHKASSTPEPPCVGLWSRAAQKVAELALPLRRRVMNRRLWALLFGMRLMAMSCRSTGPAPPPPGQPAPGRGAPPAAPNPNPAPPAPVVSPVPTVVPSVAMPEATAAPASAPAAAPPAALAPARKAEFSGFARVSKGFLGLSTLARKVGRLVVDGENVSWFDAEDPKKNFSIYARNIKEVFNTCVLRPSQNLCLEFGFVTHTGEEYRFRDPGWKNGDNKLVLEATSYFRQAFPTLFFSQLAVSEM